MEPVSHHIEVRKTARYWVLGDSALPVNTHFFVLHGYGMAAESFINEFQPVVRPGVLVVAPEGLSRFYRKGFSGDVVASWMTKEDRLTEISDYIAYLDSLAGQLTQPGIRNVVLGFSQGAAAASRWVAMGATRFSDLILWCGEFAPESDPAGVGQTAITQVYATDDAFIPLGQSEKQTTRLRNSGLEVKTFEFSGGHRIDPGVLGRVCDSVFL